MSQHPDDDYMPLVRYADIRHEVYPMWYEVTQEAIDAYGEWDDNPAHYHGDTDVGWPVSIVTRGHMPDQLWTDGKWPVDEALAEVRCVYCGQCMQPGHTMADGWACRGCMQPDTTSSVQRSNGPAKGNKG